MTERDLRAEEAADILGPWGDRRLRPLCTPSDQPLDLSLEATCDAFFRQMAHDPEQNLVDVPVPVIRLAWGRVLFAVGAAVLNPSALMLRVPQTWSRATLLSVLLHETLAPTRLPSGWHLPGSPAPGAGVHPAPLRMQ